MEVDGYLYGFIYKNIKKIHVFSHSNKKNCEFQKLTPEEWEIQTRDKKETIVTIPVSEDELQYLLDFFNSNLKNPMYDYSFFGERCASTCYHLLKKIDKIEGGHYYFNAFYPGQFRRKLIKQSKKSGYSIFIKEGSADRIWA